MNPRRLQRRHDSE
jgi:hypothetical protein